MSSYYKASGNDWSRKGEDWINRNDWWTRQAAAHGPSMTQDYYKKVSWDNGSPPPVSCSDWRNENPVSCSEWQSSDTRVQTPASGNDSRGWNENPVSCSDWQPSDTRLQTPSSGSDSRGWNDNPVSRSNWQSSSTWEHNPARGSDWQPSSRWDACRACLDQPADTHMNERFKMKLASKVQAATRARGQQNDTRGTAAAARTARGTGGAPRAAERWGMSALRADWKDLTERVAEAVTTEVAAAHEREMADAHAQAVGCPHADGRDAAFFKAHQVNVHYSKHNGALKYLREKAEAGHFDATRGRIAFGLDTPHIIPRLLRRRSGGEDFLFKPLGERDGEDGGTAWCWEDMVANLDDESINFLCPPDESAVATQAHGDKESDTPTDDGDTPVVPYLPRTRTIVGCDFVMDTNRHDHKRHSAAKKAWHERG